MLLKQEVFAESRGMMTTPKAFSCNSLHLTGLGELISLLPKVTHLSSTICYIHVVSACPCLCLCICNPESGGEWS